VIFISVNKSGGSNANIKNLSVQFDVDCHRRKLDKKSIFSTKPGDDLVWDNFDIFAISGNIIHALKAGGFSHIKEFLIDGEYMYSIGKKSKGKSIKEAISLLSGEKEVRKRFKEFKFLAVKDSEDENIRCIVRIKRQHGSGEKAVSINIKGWLAQEKVHTFLKNLIENIDVTELKTVPEIGY
jgi:hypothetical protein